VGLTQAMSSVRASHDYTLEAELESDDEVGDLVAGFNQMLHEIRDRDARLAGHMQTLEREVAERTAEIRVAKDIAEAANASKSEFLATMSHEIRTPMNGIMVMAEMLASADIPQRQRRYAQVIAKSGQSLLSIINDVLDFSKIEAGKMDLESTPVDLADLVDDVASLFWERARSKSIDLAAYVDPAVPRKILGDPVRLRQVIGNLVNNAIKFTETGGVLIRVETVSEGSLRISVQDTGIGIPPEKITGLFEAFTQADQSTTRRFGGTGLGLAICKRLIDAMGGRIGASSREGVGSTFTFIFPAEVAEPAQPWPVLSGDLAGATLACTGLSTRWALARYLRHSGVQLNADPNGFFLGEPQGFGALPRPAICLAEYGDPEPFDRLKARALDAVLVQPFRRSELETVLTRLRDGGSLEDLHVDDAPSASVTPRFEGRRILVADDSAVNREVAIEALSRLGAKALVVVDGLKAVEAVRADPAIDLVLMDGSMPEMDGFDATRAIREHERKTGGGRRLPIVALTADVIGSSSDAWRKAEMDAILHKPFTLAALAETLSKFMQPSSFGPAACAEESTQGANESLLDPAVTRELAEMAAGGKSDFVEKIRGLYRANAPQSLALARGAFEAGDGEGLARAAHALKSMSFNVGAKKVAALCSTLESLGRSGEPVSSGALMQLSDALDATLEALGGPAAKAPMSNEALLLADLKAALSAGDLYMVYQAQMDRQARSWSAARR
jgi:signal transduction histidine kinase/CheY-like chemotaxis protein